MSSFEKLFEDCIKLFQNYEPKYSAIELNYWADYIEILVIFSRESFVTKGDINDRLFGTKDYNNPEEKDKDESFIDEIYNLLEERINLFGKDYPFEKDSSGSIFKLASNLENKQNVYIYLLLASKLNLFKTFNSSITTEFEQICFIVLANFFSKNATIKSFGNNTEYGGTAKEKIIQLAYDLGLEVNDYEFSGISDKNTKERGLDLIAWFKFDDNCQNKLIFLAQCACGKNFESKQHDTRRFKNYLKFYKLNPINVLFIPYSFINIGERKFYHSDWLEEDFLFFERKRILQLYSGEGFKNLMSSKLVSKVIKYKEELV